MQDDHDPDGNDEAPGPEALPDVFGRPSAARSEGQLYAPPRTVPPTSDHRTIEIETVKVHKDPKRAAVTQPSLRRASQQAAEEPPPGSAPPWENVPGSEPPDAPAEVPDSTHPVIAGERSRSASAVWLLALGALVALVAVGVALIRGHSSTQEPASAQQPTAAPESAAVAPLPAPPSVTPAPQPAPVASAAPEPAASAPPSKPHHAATHPAPAPPPAKPARSAKPKYQPLF